jgi:hypothetical protein
LWAVGGLPGGSGFTQLANADLYDPATGLFSPTGNMNVSRTAHQTALLGDGKVLVAGGYGVDGTVEHASAELYDPATGVFMYTGSMANPRCYFAALGLNDGRVLVTGGST